MSQDILFLDAGLMEYKKAYNLQRRLAALVAEKRFQQTLLLLEHLPVYTMGKSGSEANVLVKGIPVVKVDRGGDITYHGPGQLVGYPILFLENKKVSRYVRTLEESLLLLLRRYGVEGSIREGFPGIWVRGEKIASVGIRVRKGVCYHGFALNISVDLKAFQFIRPCGLAVTMTSLEKILSRKIPMNQVKRNYCEAFEECFQVKLEKCTMEMIDVLAHG